MIKDLVVKAYILSQEAHQGQKRKFSGLDYFTHPKYVARVIEHLTKNETLIAAALLHDVIEDTKHTAKDVESIVGHEVTEIVFELTIDKKDKLYKKSKAEYLSQKILIMSEGAFTIKLADRFHNVLFLEEDNVNISFKKKYWLETKTMMKAVKARKLDRAQDALVDRINAVLKFLEVRYEWS